MNNTYFIKTLWTDLRRLPQKRCTLNPRQDPLQESQLLQGERVNVLRIEGSWAYIAALDQPVYNPKGNLVPYQGWVESNALTDTCPNVNIDYSESPPHQLGLEYLGIPYLWGGLTTCLPSYSESALGIDCSGLLHLIYRRQGKIIPRNAQDQFRFFSQKPLQALHPSDLLFLAKQDTPLNIYHVMIYLGDEIWLEATSDSMNVRTVKTTDKIGCSLYQLKENCCSPFNIYCYGSGVKF